MNQRKMSEESMVIYLILMWCTLGIGICVATIATGCHKGRNGYANFPELWVKNDTKRVKKRKVNGIR